MLGCQDVVCNERNDSGVDSGHPCEDAPLPQTTLFTQARPLGLRLCTQEVQVSPSLRVSFDFSRNDSERTFLNVKVAFLHMFLNESPSDGDTRTRFFKIVTGSSMRLRFVR
jgi:hypothetical protein